MALPSSGPISINAINVELGKAGATASSLGQTDFRTLAGIASGAISLASFHGKSNIKTGQRNFINNVYAFLQFGYNVLGPSAAGVYARKLVYSANGHYSDDPWGPQTVYLYGIRESDGGRDLLASFYPNARDWTAGTTVTLPGNVKYTNLNFYYANGPKTTAYFTAYISEWKE